MNLKLSSYKTLGVINMTPNSFSDQGLSLNPAYFKIQLQSFLDDPSVIVDVGFESTAPMNQAVSLEEEKNRFHFFLEASKNFSFNDRYISFDTYKVQNFKYMVSEFKKWHPKARFIFNDVSGCLDSDLKEMLIDFKGEDFYYIFTFSGIPERSLTLNHMKYVNDTIDIKMQATDRFKFAFEWFRELQMEHHLILDPGFGFSKTYEQNWELIDNFHDLETILLELKLTNPILIGLSKKSFLRKALLDQCTDESLETLHKTCIRKLLSNNLSHLLFRVHDPKIMNNL